MLKCVWYVWAIRVMAGSGERGEAGIPGWSLRMSHYGIEELNGG